MQGVRLVLAAIPVLLSPAVAEAQVAKPETQSSRPSSWAVPVELAGVPNLHRITPTLYRSAQPARNGFPAIEALGIKTVLSLRANHRDEPLARGTGLRLLRVPINTWNIQESDVATALRLLRRSAGEAPVLLHCQHGADRTGLISGLYRILYEGWTKEAAIAEMRGGNYGYHAVWGNIPKFIKAVDVDRLRRLVATK